MTTTTLTRARDLTPQEIEDRRDKCFRLEKKVKAELARSKVAAWDLARALAAFDEESGWTALNYRTLSEWLADPEIGMTRSVYYRLVKGYREIVEKRQIPMEVVQQLDPSKLDLVLPAIQQSKVELDEALDDVRSMGWRDLRETYVKQPREDADPPADPDPPIGGGDSGPDEEPVSAADVGLQSAEEAGYEGGSTADDVIEAVARDTDTDDNEPEPDPEPVRGTEALQDALDAWNLLLAELIEMADSGQTFPRVTGRYIKPGLDGLSFLLEYGGMDVDKILHNLGGSIGDEDAVADRGRG